MVDWIERHSVTAGIFILIVTSVVGAVVAIVRKGVLWLLWVNSTVKADHKALDGLSTTVADVQATATESVARVEAAAVSAVRQMGDKMDKHLDVLHARVDGLMQAMVAERARD
ncbi:MAG: hypothetical protein WC655_24915 [Candidatus Hydrogenedentales bacterium]|jgi:hypothetical protein